MCLTWLFSRGRGTLSRWWLSIISLNRGLTGVGGPLFVPGHEACTVIGRILARMRFLGVRACRDADKSYVNRIQEEVACDCATTEEERGGKRGASAFHYVPTEKRVIVRARLGSCKAGSRRASCNTKSADVSAVYLNCGTGCKE